MPLELPTTDDKLMWDLWLSAYWLPAVTAAVDIDVFESLAQSPASHTTLATRLGLSSRGTEILLPLFASLHLLVRHDGRYQLTDVARLYLLRDSPYFWGGLLERMGTASPSTTPSRRRSAWRADFNHRAQGRPTRRCLGERSGRDEAGAHDCGVDAQPLCSCGARHGAQRRLCRGQAPARRWGRLRVFLHRPRGASSGSALHDHGAAGDVRGRHGIHRRSRPQRTCRHARRRHVPAGMAARLRCDVLLEHPARLELRHLRATAREGSRGVAGWWKHLSFTRHCSMIRVPARSTTTTFSLVMLLGTQGRQFTFRELKQPDDECRLRSHRGDAELRLLLSGSRRPKIDRAAAARCSPSVSSAPRCQLTVWGAQAISVRIAALCHSRSAIRAHSPGEQYVRTIRGFYPAAGRH